MSKRFLPELENRLRAAGWFPGRLLGDEELESLDEEKPLFVCAQRAIEEFGGLYVAAQRGWGNKLDSRNADYRRSDHRRSFYIEPWALMRDEQLGRFERSMKRRLYPLGFIDYSFEPAAQEGREYAMFIDEDGRVFAFHHFTGGTQLMLGTTFEGALNNLGLETGFRLWDLNNDLPLESPYIFTDWWK